MKHAKKTSSLFNLRTFPIDGNYDLFATTNVDNDEITNLTNLIGFNDNKTSNNASTNNNENEMNENSNDQDGQQCLIM